MKIAVIGAGVAGLGAAWALRGTHDVTVYERSRHAGGHAMTIDVSSEAGTVPVDVGFLLFDEWAYPQLTALFRTLRVETSPYTVSMGVSIGDDEWSTACHDTPFWRRVADEADRFSRTTPEIALLSEDVSIGAYLAAEGYSLEFARKALAPLLSPFLTRRGVLDAPAALVGTLFRRNLSFYHPIRWRTVRGGSREYVRRMVADLDGCLRLGHGAARVRRETGAVLVTDAGGVEERFDHVVLAVAAPDAAAILEDADAEEARVLSAARFQHASLAVHRNPGVMPRNRTLWSTLNYVETIEDGEVHGSDLTGMLTSVEAARIFRTYDTPTSVVPPEGRLAEIPFTHVVCDTAYGQAVRRLGRLEGRNRTWYCGGHLAALPYHETAFLSGLLVADALGADYPFPHDARAVAQFRGPAQAFRRSSASLSAGASNASNVDVRTSERPVFRPALGGPT